MNPLFLERRSCRKYLNQPVEKAKIDDVIQAGLYAPSGMGKQNGVILAITNKKTRDDLSRLNARIMTGKEEMDPFYGAPVVLLVLVKKCNTPIYDGAAMIENMLLQATEDGLGSCWIHRAKEEIESEEGRAILAGSHLHLEDYEGIGHVILGYADGKPGVKTIREGRIIHLD